MKHNALLSTLIMLITLFGFSMQAKDAGSPFIRISGDHLVTPDGKTFFIRGTNLGNWLNPEGYMFGFQKTNSPRFINEMFCQLAGEDFTAEFWKLFKDNYITRRDVEYIASTGANTIRLPFHYKLFTDEDYMGLTSCQDGFARIDSVVDWCRDNGLYLILDMHDAPGGQTGDNIDDSYAYPWLFESARAQQLLCDIWQRIAARYSDEPVILGYEICNEPIAHFFDNKEELNSKLEPLYKRAVKAIREKDRNHIVLLGGAQWNSNFSPFTDFAFDDKIMFTCHRYGGEPTREAFSHFIEFMNRTGLPMYMGEIGHNSMEWQRKVCDLMEAEGIGYTFWPYKKINDSCMMGFSAPEGWDRIVAYSETPRPTYASIRENRLSVDTVRAAMLRLVENFRFENCTPQEEYIASMKLRPVKKIKS